MNSTKHDVLKQAREAIADFESIMGKVDITADSLWKHCLSLWSAARSVTCLFEMRVKDEDAIEKGMLA